MRRMFSEKQINEMINNTISENIETLVLNCILDDDLGWVVSGDDTRAIEILQVASSDRIYPHHPIFLQVSVHGGGLDYKFEGIATWCNSYMNLYSIDAQFQIAYEGSWDITCSEA